MLRRVNVVLGIVEIRGDRGDKLGTGRKEKFLENGKGFRAATLHTRELVTVFLAECGMDGIIKTDGAKGDTNGDEGVHLVILFGNLGMVLLMGVICRYLGKDLTESN
jgi:hypothetical protein